jgi:hypothetical protein
MKRPIFRQRWKICCANAGLAHRKESTVTEPVYLAVIYRLTAVTFWDSAKVISASLETNNDRTPSKITAIPFYFLISHAAELFLKSALLKRGFQEGDLKKFDYRHNLIELMEELQRKGLSITPDTVSLIRGLHAQHQSHALRYTVLADDGQKTYMPPVPLVFSMLEELQELTRISAQGI